MAVPATMKKSFYDREYKKNNYDSILFRVKKGKADEYRQAAQDIGIAFWELIRIGIEEFIARHSGKEIDLDNRQAAEIEKISKADKQLLEEFNKLPIEAQKSFLKTFKAINEAKT